MLSGLSGKPLEGGKVILMSGTVRVQVLMQPQDADLFERYCADRGHKKSTLIARLVREHLEREGFGVSKSRAVAGRSR